MKGVNQCLSRHFPWNPDNQINTNMILFTSTFPNQWVRKIFWSSILYWFLKSTMIWWKNSLPKFCWPIYNPLMGEGFMGGCTIFFSFLTSFFKIRKRFFESIKITSGIYDRKFFIFQMSERWFPWHPKGGCTSPHKSRGVFYKHVGHGN